MLSKVLSDAKSEGYLYAEGYPFSDKNLPYQYHGPFRLFEKHGFKLYAEKSWFHIMRKAL